MCVRGVPLHDLSADQPVVVRLLCGCCAVVVRLLWASTAVRIRADRPGNAAAVLDDGGAGVLTAVA